MEINNEDRANNLVVSHAENFSFICDMCAYLNLLEKNATNEYEACRLFHRRSALEDLITTIINLNDDFIKNQSKPADKKSKIKAI
jgi:hypothetical protein